MAADDLDIGVGFAAARGADSNVLEHLGQGALGKQIDDHAVVPAQLPAGTTASPSAGAVRMA